LELIGFDRQHTGASYQLAMIVITRFNESATIASYAQKHGSSQNPDASV